MAHQFTFDVKAFVTVHVTAESEKAARAIIDERLADILDGEGDGNLFVNSVGLDGEHDLVELDGEDPEAEDDEGYPPRCSNPAGHSWVVRDDNEEISYCEFCGADGNA